MAFDPQKLKVLDTPHLKTFRVLMTIKEFYAALFPAWKFKAAAVTEGSTEVIHISFDQPSGIRVSHYFRCTPLKSMAMLTNVGLTGGIVKAPKGMARPSEQDMSIGSTVYYFVESVDKVLVSNGATP